MDISGTWYNELGSRMEITVNGTQISGTYYSGVGDSTGTPLIGSFDSSVENDYAIGFVVVWPSTPPSVTAWSGQAKVDIDFGEHIYTTWLLTSETTTANLWQSTLVGQDRFFRIMVGVEEIQRNLNKGASYSHPFANK